MLDFAKSAPTHCREFRAALIHANKKAAPVEDVELAAGLRQSVQARSGSIAVVRRLA